MSEQNKVGGSPRPDIKKITIESEFLFYMDSAWPKVSNGTEQWAAAKMIWFSAWLNSLGVLKKVVGDPSVGEDEGVELMTKLERESEAFHINYFRQKLGTEGYHQ